MSGSIIGSQHVSISHSGTLLFEQKISTGVGGVTIDLASAPIPPGSYTLDMQTGMGGVEIYLPKYVKFVVDAHSVVGSQHVHEGTSYWQELKKKIKDTIHLSDEMPAHVAEPPAEGQVTIRFLIHTGMGGIDIYRL